MATFAGNHVSEYKEPSIRLWPCLSLFECDPVSLDERTDRHQLEGDFPSFFHRLSENLELVARKVCRFAMKGLPTVAGRTGKTSVKLCRLRGSFFGKGMVPNSQARQTLLAMHFGQAEQVKLN